MELVKTFKPRNANYRLLDAFKDFEQAPESELNNTCGNIQSVIDGSFDLDTMSYPSSIFKNGKAFYKNISSPMMLARLVSAGFVPYVSGQDGYKVTFTFVLKHKPTGCIVTFYDWKGAASVGSCYSGLSNKRFQTALKKLVKAMADERFPHPYDGCVVGEIA